MPNTMGLVELIKLNTESYVSIQHNGERSYGGNQGWWSKENTVFSRQGCGVISMCDLEIYLYMTRYRQLEDEKESHTPMTYWEYKKYIDNAGSSRYRLGVGHNTKNMGLMPYTMIKGLKESKRAIDGVSLGKRVRLSWAPSSNSNRIKEYIIDMISRDIPVVASYYVFNKENKLSLYRYDSRKRRMINDGEIRAHYFNITGVSVLDDEEYLMISSWGKKYYISYDKWAKKLSIFSNIFFLG